MNTKSSSYLAATAGQNAPSATARPESDSAPEESPAFDSEQVAGRVPHPCSARSLGRISSDFSEFEKSLNKSLSKVLYF